MKNYKLEKWKKIENLNYDDKLKSYLKRKYLKIYDR